MKEKFSSFFNVLKGHNKNTSPFFCAGFTIIELLLVIAITGILLVSGAVSFRGLRISSGLSAGASTIKLTLEKSRLSALVKENETGYNVKLNETNLVLFKGAVYSPNDSNNKIVALPPSTKITSVNLEAGGEVVSFNNLTGTTSPGTIVLTSTIDSAYARTIYLDGSGRVYHAYTSGGSGGGGGSGGQGQVADSGSQQFNLGWSIQDTSELKFNFVDLASTKIFLMQPHLNGNKSVFNYVGYFNEGGVTQKITMYSNQLDPNNTILSITREPKGVGPTLQISIDDKTLVTYFADGTVAVGANGGTMIVQ